MAPLIALAALAASPSAAAFSVPTVERWRPLIATASARCGVPAAWIARVLHAESGGRTRRGGRPIRSVRGAIGLMQLMPMTWAAMRAALMLGADPDDPHDNIVAGACYLRRMYDRFGYPGLFGAYNAGPGVYAAWLAGRRSLPAETVAYLAVLRAEVPKPMRPSPPAPTLFALRSDAPSPTPGLPSSPAPDPLFAIRKAVR